jgi:CoA:oxalate CoA-transferase
MSPGPLSGILVADLTRVLAGPFCTMMLAEQGARVIKVENPHGGDDSRAFDPFIDGKSAYFASLNRGKESIALDLTNAVDRAVFLNIVRRADILVENYRPGTMEKLVLGYERLREINPRLIYAAVSGFGHTGPMKHRAAYDLIVQAMGGIMSITGQPGGPPTKVGSSIGDITGGLFALAGISSALFWRERSGRGMKIDVSMLDGQIAILEHAVMRYAATGQAPTAMGNRHSAITPFELFRTADRDIVIAAGNDALFARICAVLGHPEWAVDERFQTNHKRNRHAGDLKQLLEGVLATRPGEHWLKVLDEAGVPCCVVNTVADAVHHPQVQARNMIVTADGVQMAGNPIKSSEFPDSATRPPAPALDADGQRIRAEFSG